jgi:hypothetical protein
VTRSQRYLNQLLDLREYQEPNPESRKKRGIIHRSTQATIGSSRSERSAFFKCQSIGVKNPLQWKRKTASIAPTRSQSMSYLRSFILFSFWREKNLPARFSLSVSLRPD